MAKLYIIVQCRCGWIGSERELKNWEDMESRHCPKCGERFERAPAGPGPAFTNGDR